MECKTINLIFQIIGAIGSTELMRICNPRLLDVEFAIPG